MITIRDREKYSLQEAAGLLGISENACRLRIVRGTMPVEIQKFGGRVFVDKSEIEKFESNGGWDTFNTFAKEM